MLADDKIWATLPIAFMHVGAGAVTIPASFLMRRFGRRAGFTIGLVAGAASGVLGIIAIDRESFALFSAANLLLGVYRAFAQYYRFAAIDVAPPDYRSRAISYVLAGGVVAGVLGPQLAIWANGISELANFTGAYVAIVALCAVGLVPVSLLRIPRMTSGRQVLAARPLGLIMRQPAFVAAVANSAGGYALMTLVMTATPLAVIASGYSSKDAAEVFQWHVVAMYLPSFFTGGLIARFGLMPVMTAGIVLFVGSAGIAVSGVELSNYIIALAMLGVAWNFCFVGGTTLLSEVHSPEEKAKIQGMNEFLVFGAVTAASVFSGGLFAGLGWDGVNYSMGPILALVVLATVWHSAAKRGAASQVT